MVTLEDLSRDIKRIRTWTTDADIKLLKIEEKLEKISERIDALEVRVNTLEETRVTRRWANKMDEAVVARHRVHRVEGG